MPPLHVGTLTFPLLTGAPLSNCEGGDFSYARHLFRNLQCSAGFYASLLGLRFFLRRHPASPEPRRERSDPTIFSAPEHP